MNLTSGCVRFVSVLVILALLTSILYPFLLSPVLLNWGSTRQEQQADLPGDEWISNPVRTNTRALTIQAPVEEIWPWLIQMGADRGGLYSYTWLESLLLCPIKNADVIHEEWQVRNPGDHFALCPGEFGPPDYEVIQVMQGQALILGHRRSESQPTNRSQEWFDTWAFVLQSNDQESTRFLLRTRTSELPGWMKVIEPGVFIMERGMMIGLKSRAENWKMDPSVEAFYKTLFGVLLAGFFLVRYLPGRHEKRGRKEASADSVSLEEKIYGWLGKLVYLPIIIYPLFSWLDSFHLQIPGGIRLIGALIFFIGNLLLLWTRRTLGESWSTFSGISPGQTLILQGPYRWIRHPMYSAMFLITSGMSLLGANLLVGFPYLILVSVMFAKWVSVEEQELTARFGEEYLQYMKGTGRIFPKVRL